jgi:hypothetical protein
MVGKPAATTDALPSPAAIQGRLGVLVRQKRILRGLMRVALLAQDERERQAQQDELEH